MWLHICFVFWHSCHSIFMGCKLNICFTSYSAIRTSFSMYSHRVEWWKRLLSAILGSSVRWSPHVYGVLSCPVPQCPIPVSMIWRSWKTGIEVSSKSTWPKSVAIIIAIIMIIASITSTVSTKPRPSKASSSSMLWCPPPAPGLSQGPGRTTAVGFRGGSWWLLTSARLLLKILMYLRSILSLCFFRAISAISCEANHTKASPVLLRRMSTCNVFPFGTISNPAKNWTISSLLHPKGSPLSRTKPSLAVSGLCGPVCSSTQSMSALFDLNTSVYLGPIVSLSFFRATLTSSSDSSSTKALPLGLPSLV